MMEQLIEKRVLLEECNQLQEENDIRYEYHQGEVFAMAGVATDVAATDVAATDVGSPKHSLIANNAGVLLRSLEVSLPMAELYRGTESL